MGGRKQKIAKGESKEVGEGGGSQAFHVPGAQTLPCAWPKTTP